eukprot:2837697-Amphidinium_carterae.1
MSRFVGVLCGQVSYTQGLSKSRTAVCNDQRCEDDGAQEDIRQNQVQYKRQGETGFVDLFSGAFHGFCDAS